MRRTALAVALVAAAVVVPAPAQAAEPPEIWPAPQRIERVGADVELPAEVLVVADADTDESTRRVVVDALHDGGVGDVVVVDHGGEETASLVVRVGLASGDNVRSASVAVPSDLPAEGYFASVVPGEVVLGGADGDGTYHAAQTLWELMLPGRIPSVRITDYPSNRVRGVVEGAYGPQWTHAEELDQIEFAGRVKFNSFVYAPKDDPYHRDQWRTPYPAARLAELAESARSAADHHVRFTYALAPGLSICYSGSADWTALTAKLRSLYDVGVRSFSVPLDDIDYDKWNCAADQQRYGTPNAEHAARAQVELLNRVQREFLAPLPGVAPLQTVPTEYWDTEDSPYKSTIRAGLDSRVVLMWTGVGVTPTSIEVFEAADAEAVWGRKPLVWDNYPVNDYPEATGRLLLGPCAERKPGISAHLTGITANPMNFAHASKVVLFGVADFTWNEAAYDPVRNARQYAQWLGGGDPDTVAALLAFFDLNHLAPVTGEDTTWQDQAPVLAERLDRFRRDWAAGGGHDAVDALWDYAWLLYQAPERIRAITVDEGFARDADAWLDATRLWSDSLLVTLNALAARVDGDEDGARRWFDEAADLAAQAAAVQSPEGETYLEGPVLVGDGVLDVFLREAPDLWP
ncbi:beta-N-acetylhexosaminidase family protein [Saccharothrix variisporea]|uniref:Hyaluronoglucosaminidase n=1 Tax=Saccharothrix variisporea TaxID=543527 RepID=A0A495XKB6_9PSEU|nr:beta-N-acetylglucosaminidase domain-containing protein [Saccharothrix variisporea]RKT74332.1 hyaluronoglucosaminidase [Saccharothrix variisporea]